MDTIFYAFLSLSKIRIKNKKKAKILYMRFFTGKDIKQDLYRGKKKSNLKNRKARKANNIKIILKKIQ
ncbi:hypothetical protein MSMAW_2904 [Methanosarcina mazei WWM610]|jgi:hypothetical protein|uniref:Uncharacterized protein n=3 Tax=Methanosarcina mazei TaxID=2209 RepID=A0A0F8I0I1_METMZ|nr:hypothetical protein MSMAW_2904 [Methanosarcina mazei WWM610]AKB68695.1 hypothetical protein MSMAL_2152 [Methanosarcina mazei LYC]KKG72899.1 hypothetical protein DU63_19210 [Methanosarcina mazei]KKH56073.1 hypothetical protein DU74_00585 [Methanosarcina mazei]